MLKRNVPWHDCYTQATRMHAEGHAHMQVREGHAGRAIAHVVVHLHGLARLPSGAGQARGQRDRLRSQGVAGRLADLGLVTENVADSAQGFQTHQ